MAAITGSKVLRLVFAGPGTRRSREGRAGVHLSPLPAQQRQSASTAHLEGGGKQGGFLPSGTPDADLRAGTAPATHRAFRPGGYAQGQLDQSLGFAAP